MVVANELIYVCMSMTYSYSGPNRDVIKEVKQFMYRYFEMKDLGVDYVILNIKLLKDDNGGIT
jgi:hypothetical protein